MNKEKVTEIIREFLTEYDYRCVIATMKSMDFMLYKHNQLIPDDNRYPDEMTMEDGLNNLVCEKYTLEDNEFNTVATEVRKLADSSCSWTGFLSKYDLEHVTLGEIRQSMREERYTWTGLAAEMILQRYESVTDAQATAVFLERLTDYQASDKHSDEMLWYITFDGRLGKVQYNSENRWAQYHLKNGNIEYDSQLRLYIATKTIDGQGCIGVKRHRKILGEIGANWNSCWIEKIEKYLDGGCDCRMIIDRDFRKAYEPDYRYSSVLDGDMVTGTSCMSGRGDYAQEFYGGIHGCYVCRFENANGEQVGRCLMYEYNGIRHFMRIYALPDYQNTALRILKEQMKESDLKGRSNYIEDMKLETDWDKTTHTMYLDGSYYGARVEDGKIYIVARNYDSDLNTTGRDEVFSYMGIIKCKQCRKLMCRRRCVRTSDDKRFCCEECARKAGYEKCDYCGTWEKRKTMIKTEDGKFFCGEYCANNNGYYKCACCKKYHETKLGSIRTVERRFYCSEQCAIKCDVKRDEYSGGFTDTYVTTKKGQVIPMQYFLADDERGAKLRHKYKMKALMNRHYKQKETTNETNND